MSPSDKIIEDHLNDGSMELASRPQPNPITGDYDLKFPNIDLTKEYSFPYQETSEDKQLDEDMKSIHSVLSWIEADKKSDGYDLSVEIIYWALKFMKEDPSLPIGEAMQLGFAEWDK